MKSAITVSLVEEAKGGPFVLWDDFPIAAARTAKYGFDGIEVFAGSPNVFGEASFAQALRENNLEFAAAGTGAGWVRHRLTLVDADAGKRKAAIDFIKQIIDAVAPWKAAVIIGSMQGRAESREQIESARSLLADALGQLSSYAAQSGSVLLIEPLNRYETNLLNTVSDGINIVQQSGATNVKLLCDIFHMNIEETNIAAALEQAGVMLGHVHFVDSNRRAVGLGHLHYAPIAAALKKINYSGYLSAEAVPLPDGEVACEKTIASFRQFSDVDSV